MAGADIEIVIPPQLPRFAKHLAVNMSPELRIEQRKMLNSVGALIKAEAQQRIHSPKGHARKGIKITVKGSGINAKVKVGPGNKAAVFSQRTRNPGRPGPPPKVALAIARRYGIKDASGTLNPVGAKRAISMHGTKGHPVMRDSWEAVRPEATRAFEHAIDTVLKKAAQEAK